MTDKYFDVEHETRNKKTPAFDVVCKIATHTGISIFFIYTQRRLTRHGETTHGNEEKY